MRRIASASILTLFVIAAAIGPGHGQQEPVPVPYVEREEVRFVFLDIVVQEKATDRTWDGWRTARDLTEDQITVLVGRQVMELDQFENRCHAFTGPDSARREPTIENRPESRGPMAGQPGDGDESGDGDEAAGSDPSPDRYILYFDLELLEAHGRYAAFQAARRWAVENAGSEVEVMIVAGARTLRIIRPLSPLTDDLEDDLASVLDEIHSTEMWADAEYFRILELAQILKNWIPIKGIRPSGVVAMGYAAIDRSKTRRSLENLRELMTLFESIEGTKNLILFADIIRFFPGEQYPGLVDKPTNISTDLQRLSRAANERNVRIYPVQAGVGHADAALLLLADETGGQYLDGTNRLDRIFEKVERDLACFYRVGFTMKQRYTGNIENIVVRVKGENRKYRVRHRTTLHDRTPGELATDMIRAAFLEPGSERGLGVTVNATELLNHAGISHLRIEMKVPLASLLPLPVPGDGRPRYQVRAELGVRVVPLRRRPTSGGASQRDHAGNTPGDRTLADVDTERETFGFGRQAILTLPPTAGQDEAPTVLVLAREIDAPPGDYLVIAVVHDQLARSTGAARREIEVRLTDSESLGDVHLSARQRGSVMLTKGADDRSEDLDTTGRPPLEVPPLMPPELLLVDGNRVDTGVPYYLSYAVCHNTGQDDERTGEETGKLTRTLACGSTPISLPPPSRMAEQADHTEPCVMLVEQIPAGLPPGTECRFEVVLDRPGGVHETKGREFSIHPPDDSSHG